MLPQLFTDKKSCSLNSSCFDLLFPSFPQAPTLFFSFRHRLPFFSVTVHALLALLPSSIQFSLFF